MEAKRDLYNPYVLNLLYTKVLFLDRLYRAHLAQCGEAEFDEARFLVRHQQLDQLVVADVCELVRLMRDEQFRFDLYYANYEYILFRMLNLFLPPSEAEPLPEVEVGDAFGCELKCLAVVETLEQQRIFTAAVMRYLAQYYFGAVNQSQPLQRARQRATLLFNTKRAVEQRVAQRYPNSQEYTIRYYKDVVTTMLYLMLVNELLAQAHQDAVEHSLRTASLMPLPLHLDRGQSEEIDSAYARIQVTERDQRTLDATVALLQQLSDVLAQQYEDEVCGFQVINAFPQCPSPLPPNTEDPEHFRDYVRSGCVLDSVALMRSSQTGFTLREVPTRGWRYVSLLRNGHLYRHAVRRFLFDHALLVQLSAKEAATAVQARRYVAENQTLFDFYQQSELNAYHTCHYVVRDSPRLANESLLHLFLAPVVVDVLTALHGVFYKNAWQLARLWPSASRETPLFLQLDVTALLEHVTAHYDATQGGSDARIALELQQACQRTALARAMPPFRRTAHVTEYHTALAIDIDMVLCVTRAVCAQQNEMERYDRSLRFPLGESAAALLKRAIVTLTRLYNFYVTCLVETLER